MSLRCEAYKASVKRERRKFHPPKVLAQIHRKEAFLYVSTLLNFLTKDFKKCNFLPQKRSFIKSHLFENLISSLKFNFCCDVWRTWCFYINSILYKRTRRKNVDYRIDLLSYGGMHRLRLWISVILTLVRFLSKRRCGLFCARAVCKIWFTKPIWPIFFDRSLVIGQVAGI